MGSCGANRRELEDQSSIKGNLRPNWDKTKLVSHFGEQKKTLRRREEKIRSRGRRRRRKVWKL